jgi:hypothetical protein
LKNPLFRRLRINNIDVPAGGFRGLDLEKTMFQGYFNNYNLIKKFDFDGPKRTGIKKRVYVFKRKV